jgi:hypothetical protein
MKSSCKPQPWIALALAMALAESTRLSAEEAVVGEATAPATASATPVTATPVTATPATATPATEADAYLTAQTAPLPGAPERKAGSLRFLNGNRAFLLTRLSANAGPGAPDPRLKSWLDEEMLRAMSTLGEAESALPSGGLTAAADWPELEALSVALDSLSARVIGIDHRLRSLRDDFAQHQATELMIAVAAPAELATGIEAVHLRWNGHEVTGITLGAEDRAALVAGGYRPLHRTFARPETQAIEVEMQLSGGRILRGQTHVDPEPNRLTVIVLDAQLTGVEARVWTL